MSALVGVYAITAFLVFVETVWTEPEGFYGDPRWTRGVAESVVLALLWPLSAAVFVFTWLRR